MLRTKIRTKVYLIILGIVVLTIAAAGSLFYIQMRAQTELMLGKRAKAIAAAAAAIIDGDLHQHVVENVACLLYTSPSPRDR